MKLDKAETRWRAALVRARELLDERDTAAARETLAAARSYVERIWGPDDLHLIGVLVLLARSFAADRDLRDAHNDREVECLEEALATARRKLPPDHPEIGKLAGTLGISLYLASRLDDACALMLECVTIARKNGDEHKFSHYVALVGEMRTRQGRLEEAASCFERNTLSVAQREPSSRSLALARQRWAEALLALGKKGEGVQQLRLALDHLKTDRAYGHGQIAFKILKQLDSAHEDEESSLGGEAAPGAPPNPQEMCPLVGVTPGAPPRCHYTCADGHSFGIDGELDAEKVFADSAERQ